MDKEKNKEENNVLSQKIKTVGHQEVHRQHIKDQEKLLSIGE